MFLRVFILLLFWIEISQAVIAKLEGVISVSGAVSEISIHQNKLYVATERGTVEIVDLASKKIIKKINYPKFEDFMGELQLPKVFSVDVSPDGKIIAAAVQATRGGREVYIYNLETKKLQKIISRKYHYQIVRLRFIDNSNILLGLGGDELVLFDINNKKEIYRKPVGMSFFSDMEVNEDKTKVAIVDESGDTRIADIKTGKVIKVIEELNKDKVFDVDFRNNRTFSGGRDKKAVFYNLSTNQHRIFEADDFMVFSVALSPSAKLGAYLYNANFDIKVVNTETGDILTTLTGHKVTPGVIKFLNENYIVVGCDDKKIYFWRIER